MLSQLKRRLFGSDFFRLFGSDFLAIVTFMKCHFYITPARIFLAAGSFLEVPFFFHTLWR